MALAEFIVSFREVFEILLILGIMLACLRKAGAKREAKYIYAGAGAAVLASVAVAAVFQTLSGGFEEYEALFEGATMALSAVFVTWFIVWMLKHSDVEGEIWKGMNRRNVNGSALGLAAFAFIAVFREGVEIVLFLAGIWAQSGALNFAAAALGALAAILLALAVFRGIAALDIGLFFKATTAFLILLAAGLLSQGVHELQEAKVVPTSIEHIYDITPQQNADGSYPLMHEKGAVGAVLKSLFGYDTAPSLEQAAAYIGYLALVLFAYRRAGSRG